MGLRLVLAGLWAFGTLTYAGHAHAQNGPVREDHARLTARDLASQGVEAFDRGEYQASLALVRRAHELVQAPTICIYIARSLEKLDKWVEAAEAFRRCATYQVQPDASEAFRQAVKDAERELQALLPRIPRLTVVVPPGTKPEAALLTLDGSRLPVAMIGVKLPVDPGRHELRGTNSTGMSVVAAVEILEGQSLELGLPLASPSKPKPDVLAFAREGAPASSPSAGSWQRTLGWVGLGVGAAGLGTGIATGLIAVAEHRDAERHCLNYRCIEGSTGEQAVERFRSLRTVSAVSYIVGATGLGAGAILLLTAPKAETARHARVTPYVGLARAGFTGTF